MFSCGLGRCIGFLVLGAARGRDDGKFQVQTPDRKNPKRTTPNCQPPDFFQEAAEVAENGCSNREIPKYAKNKLERERARILYGRQGRIARANHEWTRMHTN